VLREECERPVLRPSSLQHFCLLPKQAFLQFSLDKSVLQRKPVITVRLTRISNADNISVLTLKEKS